ncbi:MAG TPA: RuBisCO large subunit C-terminal-like domain-containing protein [Rhodopila sp.]|uniref:RuBisCO large subunit C-terminal-like domain-containing protein n=1 Tax=Rhodopila sp. TaxID=2480087 RepID=UPI002C36F9D5|nr:RuBisCO large subunit C-terminal-like domain-containing protein [Rhodopila sp.]HVY15733.1 RuBisCO large subunit C-terminal-like domain-containing protein [Rhodopila sp.]
MRLSVTYHVRADAADIAARAKGIAVEQSVEMPLEAIDEPSVLRDIVGSVEDIADLGHGRFAVRIGLALATIGDDPGQLLNMLFGNTSLQEDVVLADVDLPEALIASFARPRHRIEDLRRIVAVGQRALTASALKPQGLPPERLGQLAERLTLGGLDFIKDDHGLADQDYSRFAMRVTQCAAAIARAARRTGHPTQYIPSLTGDLDQLRSRAALARDAGLACVMVAPMVSGVSAVRTLARAYPDLAIFAHPSMGGLRIAPDLLIGKLFPLFGADAVIFPSHGGRFGYSPETCLRLATNARRFGALPVPAGGMTLQRTPEILDFYGPDTMLLIGGNLLLARERIPREAAAFTAAVAAHRYA